MRNTLAINIIVPQNQKILYIQRRGAALAMEAIAKRFGEDLETKMPKLWSMFTYHSSLVTTPEELVTCLQVLELTCSFLHAQLLPKVKRGSSVVGVPSEVTNVKFCVAGFVTTA